MTPTTIEGETRIFVSPTNFNQPCGDLSVADVVEDGLPIMYSAWKPTMEEVTAMLLGAPVILGIVGTAHPVVRMFTGAPTDEVG